MREGKQMKVRQIGNKDRRKQEKLERKQARKNRVRSHDPMANVEKRER